MVSYTAVVLTSESRRLILETISSTLETLKVAGYQEKSSAGADLTHHMTCNMGECPPENRHLLGNDVLMTISEWGVSEKAFAVKVSEWQPDFKIANSVPHITVAIGPTGKPKDSNQINMWFPLKESIMVEGKFLEVRA